MKTIAIELLEYANEHPDSEGDFVFDHYEIGLILTDVKRIQDFAWTLANEAHQHVTITPEEQETMTIDVWQNLQEAIDRRLNVDLAIIYGGVHAAPNTPIAREGDGNSPTVPAVSDENETRPGSMGDDEQPG